MRGIAVLGGRKYVTKCSAPNKMINNTKVIKTVYLCIWIVK